METKQGEIGRGGEAGIPARDSVLWVSTLELTGKTFHFSVRKNDKGVFLKIMGHGRDGNIIVPGRGVRRARDLLQDLLAHARALPPFDPAAAASSSSQRLKSVPLRVEPKRYAMDLSDNKYGRFVRFVLLSGQRKEIIIPIEGLPKFIDMFNTVLEECQEISEADAGEMAPIHFTPAHTPPSYTTVAGHKRFFIDPGMNEDGSYIKIAEVRGPQRNVVILPASVLPALSGVISSYIDAIPPSQRVAALDGVKMEQVTRPGGDQANAGERRSDGAK